MKFTLILLIFTFYACFVSTKTLTGQPPKSKGNIHAVIVAGSKGAENYRHQANACHAYHVLRNNGIAAENIILMMYDDAANDPQNPFPGKLFNEPNGTDVYAGCVKDYTHDEVTPENFMKALKGDKELAKKGKKVLTSGPDDHVFIYFTDHGAAGIVCFPEASLTSDDLSTTLKYMHENGLYGKLTFYLEACESGSMFANILPTDINIYGITSTTADQYGYACYCSEPKIPFCLSDEFSIGWMRDTERNDPTKETLETQFERLIKAVQGSTPQQYGTEDIANMVIGEFEGESKSSETFRFNQTKVRGRVNKRDAPLHYWRRRLQMAKDNEVDQVKSKLSAIIEGRHFYDRAIRNVINDLCRAGFCSSANDILSTRFSLFNHKTYSLVAKHFHSKCINLGVHSYALQYMYAFANFIESQADQFELPKFLSELSKACDKHIVGHGYESIV